MTRGKRAFEARGGGNEVGLYCCGVTVYDYSHIGEGEKGERGRERVGDGRLF
jgi:cysteinyl-tRNA synthetase